MPSGFVNYVSRHDPKYDHWVATHQARTVGRQVQTVLLHLAPGLFGLIAVKVLTPWLMGPTGIRPHWIQFILLGSMAIGWELTMPFVWLRREGLTFRESLESLGLLAVDWKGLALFAPLSVIAVTVVGFPYLAYGYEPVRLWLNQWSPIAMPEWHILNWGYYNFPLLPLVIVFVGNFLGEEVYFRGYLLKRLGWLGPVKSALVSNALFCTYHFWQAPVNWAYLPVFWLLPFGFGMIWRKSLWVTVAVHVMINFGLMDWVVSRLQGMV